MKYKPKYKGLGIKILYRNLDATFHLNVIVVQHNMFMYFTKYRTIIVHFYLCNEFHKEFLAEEFIFLFFINYLLNIHCFPVENYLPIFSKNCSLISYPLCNIFEITNKVNTIICFFRGL